MKKNQTKRTPRRRTGWSFQPEDDVRAYVEREVKLRGGGRGMKTEILNEMIHAGLALNLSRSASRGRPKNVKPDDGSSSPEGSKG